MITLRDLLHARLHDLTEEHHRERVLPRQSAAGRALASASATVCATSDAETP